jgi:hypothetical protein
MHKTSLDALSRLKDIISNDRELITDSALLCLECAIQLEQSNLESIELELLDRRFEIEYETFIG